MSRHDLTGWQLDHTKPPFGWYDITMAALCVLVASWWAYDYIERLV
jgi:hypothetical protein